MFGEGGRLVARLPTESDVAVSLTRKQTKPCTEYDR